MLTRRSWCLFPKTKNAYRLTLSARSSQARRYTSSYLLRVAETDENIRLDTQHRMNIHMMHNNLLHPAIPKHLERVADIATGNGTWLFDLIKSRKEDPTTNADKTAYHGFDISPALFPKHQPANLTFSLHDFYKPFPQDYIGKYDFVHIRHLSVAIPIKGSGLATAINNITSLLKPCGYIQWEEYNYAPQIAALPPQTAMTATWKVIFKWVEDNGYSLTFPDCVRSVAEKAGMEVIEQKQFSTGDRPFCEDHRLTLLYAFDTGVPRLCLRGQGRSEEDVEEVIRECLKEWEGGLLADYFLTRLVLRKGGGA
ncbi:hypothetical protein BJX61DRAFT_317454 [Aspergillus egyptiacus]|nr:hypothetical protein BJX61DRAFT_317454 [Aspergillus egyptiacus]